MAGSCVGRGLFCQLAHKAVCALSAVTAFADCCSGVARYGVKKHAIALNADPIYYPDAFGIRRPACRAEAGTLVTAWRLRFQSDLAVPSPYFVTQKIDPRRRPGETGALLVVLEAKQPLPALQLALLAPILPAALTAGVYLSG